MQPMNYMIQTPSGGQMMSEALTIAGQVAQRNQFLANAEKAKAEQAALVAQQEEAERKRQSMIALARNPNRSAKDIENFMLEHGEVSKQFQDMFATMQESEQRQAVATMSLVREGLKNKRPDVVVAELDRQIEAAKNSNNPSMADKLDMVRNMVIADPNAADLTANFFLRANMDPVKYEEMVGKRGAEERAQEEQPYKIKNLKAENVVKELEAKFAPEQMRAQLGLTRAQTASANASANAANASAAASRATADRARAEAGQISSGVIPAEKRPEAEGRMRDEYFKRTAVYQEVKDAFGRVLSAGDDAAGDLSLIFSYMKMLDPGSVVREGEFANAQNAAGIPDRVRNLYNNSMRGERLNPGQRKMFKGQAKSIYEMSSKQESEVRSGIKRIATGYGLNTENIFYSPEETRPKEQSQGLAVGTKLPGGFTVIGVGQ
jgi:hypothetical protein